MKLNKKFLSCFLAGTMVMAPMSALAAPSSTITGTGTVKPLDTEIYNVVLPTSDGIKFTVDPFGLLSITGSKNLADVVSEAAGTVTSAATAVINKSSVDVNVNVETWMTISGASLKLTDDIEEAKSGVADLYLAITEISGASVKTVTTGAAITDAGLDSGVYSLSGASITGGTLLDAASGEAVTAVASSEAITFNLTLDDVADLYTVTSAGAVDLVETANTDYKDNSYVFAITGYANPKSEAWDALAQSGSIFELNMKFTLSGGSALPGYSVLNSSTYWLGVADGVAFSNVSAVKVNGADLDSTNYALSSNFVTIKSNVVDWFNTNQGGCVVTVTDANGTYSVDLSK